MKRFCKPRVHRPGPEAMSDPKFPGAGVTHQCVPQGTALDTQVLPKG